MPKNKTQGIIFGIIMSYSMAVGMEIYNNAIQQGVHLQPGGFTNLTYGIVGKALVEALFMGLIVIIVSELWGNRLGARFAAKVSDPQRDNPYFCRLMRQGGHRVRYVPHHESGGHHYFQHDLRRCAGVAAARHLGGDAYQELPHGVFLEYVCRRTLYQLGLRKAVRIKERSPAGGALLLTLPARTPRSGPRSR